MINTRIKIILPVLCAVLGILYTQAALPCNVPVFRYALERWPADLYEVIVFHRSSLSSDDSEVVKWLENSSIISDSHANFTIQTVDISSSVPTQFLDMWQSLDKPELPCMAVRYPASIGYMKSIWTGRLSMNAARSLVDSPVRREIINRILDGNSAVWVLLESGDRTRDNAAAQLLESQLSDLEKTLTLPGAVDGNYGLTAVDTTDGPEVKIAFSLVRLARKDPAEPIFAAMLTHSEPDLFEYEAYPMAFPVYGRGRALYALVGDGITERNIRAASEFITGACSCEVKELNPGVDILMLADWEGAIRESWIQDAELPPLVGLSELIQASVTADTSGAAATTTRSSGNDASNPQSGSLSVSGYDKEHITASQSGKSETDSSGMGVNTDNDSEFHPLSGNLLRNILLAFGVIVAVITILTVKVGMKKTEIKR